MVEVDSKVAEKEKEDRKLEIYNRIDAKSYTTYRGHKFKKSDILQGTRSLKFEGVAMLMQGRGKMQIVLVIVLSDVLFFLQENSHKYSFFTPDNKVTFLKMSLVHNFNIIVIILYRLALFLCRSFSYVKRQDRKVGEFTLFLQTQLILRCSS